MRTKRAVEAFRFGARAGASDGGDSGRGERVAPGRPEERVAGMDEDPDVSQESVLGSGGVPHELGDPRPVGLGADARDLTAAAGQVTQDQHGDAGQAAWRPDRDREAVGGGEHVPVGRETLPPGRARLAVGGGFEDALLAHVGEGAPRDLMTEVAAGTPTPGVAPRAVLGGHPDDEPADRVHAPWAARSATAAVGYCQVEADSRFWCQAWRVHDGLERSILGVDRLALRQLDSTQAAAPAGRLRYVAPRLTSSPRATHHRVRARRMPMRGPRSNWLAAQWKPVPGGMIP